MFYNYYYNVKLMAFAIAKIAHMISPMFLRPFHTEKTRALLNGILTTS